MRSPITQFLKHAFSIALVALFAVWPVAAQNRGGAVASVSAGTLDSSRLPDISGLHLGTSLADATALMKKMYPRGVGVMNGGPFGPQNQTAVGVLRAQGDGRDAAGVDLTMPPNPQVVWHMARDLVQPNVAHNVLVAALRQKYGKETYAAGPGGRPVTDDSQIQQMWWVFDEQGRPTSQVQILNGVPFGCQGAYTNDNTGVSFSYYRAFMAGGNADSMPPACASSYVGVLATMSNQPILQDVNVDIVDLPLLNRSAAATNAWVKGQDDKARQDQLQRANQARPTL
jgi:hypothetical protein